jgi:hypothetical protein
MTLNQAKVYQLDFAYLHLLDGQHYWLRVKKKCQILRDLVNHPPQLHSTLSLEILVNHIHPTSWFRSRRDKVLSLYIFSEK